MLSGRRLLVLLAVLVATVSVADQKLKMSFKEYRKRSLNSTSQEAYQRALKRLQKVELGMRSHQFFTRMEMLYLKDEKGRAVDGFCEGHLRRESKDMTAGKEPDHYLVFGYYDKPQKKKGPNQKFYVVFRHKVLCEVGFFSPADDPYRISGKLEGYEEMTSGG